METSYQQAIENNTLVVGYALGYQQTGDKRYLHGMHNLLLSTTEQVGRRIIEKAGLPYDLLSDMSQEAFLRLPSAVECYSWERNPVFITYWRTVLHNHLVGLYTRHWRHKSLPAGMDESKDSNLAASLMLQEIADFVKQEVATWKNEKHVSLTLAILNDRILKLPEDQLQQKDIAQKFMMQPGLVSQWENWLRKLITEKFS